MSRLLAAAICYAFLLLTYVYKLDGKPKPRVQGPQWGTDTEPQPLADGEVIDTYQPIRVHPNLDTAQPWLNETDRAKAAIVLLASNEEYTHARKTVVQLEANFNGRFQYPYVFINDHPYEELFRQNMYRLVGHRARYGIIETTMMDHRIVDNVVLNNTIPSSAEKARIMRKAQMNRYVKGHIFSNPTLQHLDYIWLITPGTELTCGITYDPFTYMQKRNLKYGWNAALKRSKEQISRVLEYSQDFMLVYPEYQASKDIFKPRPSKTSSSFCEFDDSLQIFDARFFRDVKYWRYFEWVDQRIDWLEGYGQSVLSHAVRLFLKRNEIYYFSDIGSKNADIVHCPQPNKLHNKCSCNKKDSIELKEQSCAHNWY